MTFALASIVLNSLAQLALKKLSITVDSPSAYFASGYAYVTIFLYVGSILFWIKALKSLNLSLAFPLQSLGFVFVSFLSVLFFGEHLRATNYLALIFIVTGALLLGISK